MNCRNFETIINELARASLMDAETRTSAMAHAETCARCAVRLADEKALTLGLHAMNAALSAKQAPARTEAALLAAFRAGGVSAQKSAGAQAAAMETAGARELKTGPGAALKATTDEPVPSRVVVPLVRKARGRWSWKSGAAIAAAILVAVTLGLLRLQPRQGTAASSSASSSSSNSNAEASTQSGGATQAANSEPATGVMDEPLIDGGPAPIRPHRRPASYQVAAMSGRLRRSYGETALDVNNAAATRTGNAGSGASEAEIATDFMPLTYDAGSMESGHVVRVELPRRALVSMGLPMNQERDDEPVKADVLLGDDGVARAIRFVSTASVARR